MFSAMVISVVSQQKGSWFESRLGSFCVEFLCSPRCMCGFTPGTLVSSHRAKKKNRHVRLIIILGPIIIDPRSECDHGWLFILFVSMRPYDGLATCPGCTPPLAQ